MDRGEESTRFNITDKVHTTYYNRFFTLRVVVSVGGQTVEISTSDQGVLQLSSRYPRASVPFDSVMDLVDTAIRQHGVSGVSHDWCENEAPIFALRIRPGDDLSKLLRTTEKLQTKLAGKIKALLFQALAETDSSTAPHSPLSVSVHAELYLVTPNAANSSVHLVPVSADNLLVCLDLWRDSTVFDFGAAFTAHRAEPSQEENEGNIAAKILSLSVEIVGYIELYLRMYLFWLNIITSDN